MSEENKDKKKIKVIKVKQKDFDKTEFKIDPQQETLFVIEEKPMGFSE
ncbi:MAG: hypothetical protein JXR70_13080 [Spirochaetales bacterium]|nr:hypothetical protein [Spirochaetales bacterium]